MSCLWPESQYYYGIRTLLCLFTMIWETRGEKFESTNIFYIPTGNSKACFQGVFFSPLVCYKLWCVDEGFFPCSNDCILRFQGAVHDNPIFCVISWLSSWMKILAALKQEVRCSCSLSVLFRSMFPFSWWKVIHHLHPWILPAFFWTTFLSPWYLGPMKEINRFNTTPGPGSWEQVRPRRP